MKNVSLLILTLTMLFSCQKNTSQKEQRTQSENEEVVETASPQSLPLNILVSDLSEYEIPKAIEIKGDLLIAKKWKDFNGENILVISRKGPIQETEYEFEFSGDERYAELYGEQYIRQGDQFELLWDIYDFVRHCPFDLWIGCLPNSTRITDLDNNGITETTIIYKLTCRSDISPSRMKLLMHENNVKMALRGTMILGMDKDRITDTFEHDLSKVDTTGLSDFDRIMESFGRYVNESDFNSLPHEFIEFARDSWKEHVGNDLYEQL